MTQSPARFLSSAFALVLCLATGKLQAAQFFWSGSHPDPVTGLFLASDPQNWSEPTPQGAVFATPRSGDSVIFDFNGGGLCTWDLNIFLASFDMVPKYRGQVKMVQAPTIGGQTLLASGILNVQAPAQFLGFVEAASPMQINSANAPQFFNTVSILPGGTLQVLGPMRSSGLLSVQGGTLNVAFPNSITGPLIVSGAGSVASINASMQWFNSVEVLDGGIQRSFRGLGRACV